MITTTVSPSVEHAECVSGAMTSILTHTCGLEVATVDQAPRGDKQVVAVISLVGDVEWTLFVDVSRDTAAAVTSKFAGFTIAPESGDLVDAMGELANILAGEVKAQLDQRGVKVSLSLPNVLTGENVHILISKDAPVCWTCLGTPVGTVSTGVAVGKHS